MSAFSDGKSAFSVYMAEVGSCEPISREAERLLARAYIAGDKEAGTQLVRANLRFVVEYAKRFKGCGIEYEDLVQEGNYGLLRALRKYAPDRENSRDASTNVKFISFAQYWVKAMILRTIKERGKLVRVGRAYHPLIVMMRRLDAKLQAQFGRDATDDELAEELAVTPERVKAVRDISGVNFVSYDAPLEHDDFGSVRGDGYKFAVSPLPAVDDVLARHELNAKIATIVRRATPLLPLRERTILAERLMAHEDDAKALAEIGNDMGISRERVRQIETRLKDILRPKLQHIRD